MTGAFGAIGSRYVEHATRAGHTATIVDCGKDKRHQFTATRLRDIGSRTFAWRIESVDWSDYFAHAEDDAIVHAAAHTGIPHSAEDPDDDWRSNVDATRAILEGLRKTSRKVPMVALSSVKPYRVSPNVIHGHGVNEETVLEPDEPYAASKAAQSMLCMAYARQYDLPVTVLRCSNLYADAPCHGPRHGWLTWFCIAAAIGRPIEIQGDGKQSRDMLFCDDVSAGIDAALANIDTMRGHVYNIGGGSSNVISVRDAVEEIGRTLGHRVEVVHGPARKNDDAIFVTDTRKLYKATGWAPKVGVRDGIARVLAWAQENREALVEVYE